MGICSSKEKPAPKKRTPMTIPKTTVVWPSTSIISHQHQQTIVRSCDCLSPMIRSFMDTSYNATLPIDTTSPEELKIFRLDKTCICRRILLVESPPEDDLSVTARLAHFLQLPVCAPRYHLAPEYIHFQWVACCRGHVYEWYPQLCVDESVRSLKAAVDFILKRVWRKEKDASCWGVPTYNCK